MAAAALRTKLQPIKLSGEEDLEHLPAMIDRDRPDALLVFPDPLLFSTRERIVQIVTAARIPAIYPFREFTSLGGLMSYGVNIAENYRRAAAYVDRILKGARPGDLPIQQPTKSELVLNQRMATEDGVTIPPSILLRIDERVE